jgi:D-beta-D-heptose 7-phosphate kinase/D-beta-D-heptose 1-phosphate adenosyltransferase
MAGNVAENLQALGIEVYSEYNGGTTPIKTRYVDERSGQILLRVDANDKVIRINNNTLKGISNNQYNGVKIDAIVVSDYDKGFLEEEDIEFICKNNSNVFIDTKKILGSWCKYASFIKINHVEYQRTEYTIQELGIEDKMIITLSSKGCQHKGKLYPVEKVQIRDVSGAGDTFLSGLVSEFILTKDKNGNFISGGYRIQSNFLDNGDSPMKTYNTNDQYGGKVSSSFENLAVPAGLFYVNMRFPKKDSQKNEHFYEKHTTVSDDLFDKLFYLVEADKKRKRKTRKHLEKHQPKLDKHKTRRHKHV